MDAAPIPAGQYLLGPSQAHSQRMHIRLHHRLSAIFLPEPLSTTSPLCGLRILSHYASPKNGKCPESQGGSFGYFPIGISRRSGASMQQSDRVPLPPTMVMCHNLSLCRPGDTCHSRHSHRGALDALRSGWSLVCPCIPISRQAAEHRPSASSYTDAADDGRPAPSGPSLRHILCRG